MQPNEKMPPTARDWAAVLFALLLPTLVTLAYFVWAESFSASVQQSTYTIAKCIQFGFPVFWVFAVQRQRFRLALPAARGAILGILFGCVVAFTMIALYENWLKSAEFFVAAEAQMQEKIAGLAIDEAWKFAALGVFYSIFHSLLEEYYWRWFVFGQLRRLIPWQLAVVVSSLGFMAHHVIVLSKYFGAASLVTWLFSLAIAIGGAFWAWLYHRSGSLLGPWLGHLLVDAAIFWIGYQIVLGMAAP